MLTSTQYFAAGQTQLDGLTLEARANAARSLTAHAPGVSIGSSAAILATVNQELPHFVIDANGAPILIIPPPSGAPPSTPFDNGPPSPASSTPASGVVTAGAVNPAGQPTPSTPASVVTAQTTAATQTPAPALNPGASSSAIVTSGPCPSGFVTSGAPSPQPRTIEQQIIDAFSTVPVSQTTQAAACVPTPVLAVQQLVTKDDSVRVFAINSYDGEANLTVTVRVLGCDNQIMTSVFSLTLSHVQPDVATEGSVCIQLSDGYLMGVTVSGAPFCSQHGEVWVQGEIHQAGCAGPISVPLFSDYLVDANFVGWPGGRQSNWGEGPGADYGFTFAFGAPGIIGWNPMPGTEARVKNVSLKLQTSAAGFDRTVTLQFNSDVGPAQYIFAGDITQPVSTTYRWLFAPGIQPGLHSAFNVVGIPIPDNLFLTYLDGLRVGILASDPGDRVLDGGVTFKSWARGLL
jgi:hypothetical protein